MRTTTRMMSISWKPMPNIRAPFGFLEPLLYPASPRKSKDARRMSDRISGYPIGQSRGIEYVTGVS
jgi:hypothetical protein